MFSIDNSLLLNAISAAAEGFTLADPHQPDCPLVFANASFLRMTGYEEKEIIGRNCRFLQGPKTDRTAVEHLRYSIAQETPCSIELINYRKDGTSFWNRISVAPVFNIHQKLCYFIGIQSDVTANRQLLAERETHLAIAQAHLDDTQRSTGLLSGDVQKSLKTLNHLLDSYDEHPENFRNALRTQLSSLTLQISLLATILETNSNDILNYITARQKIA